MRLTKLYQNFFSRQNVGKQLMTLFICTILIPILMIGGIIYLYSYRQITQNYEHLSQSKATQVRSVLVSTTLYLNEICEDISGTCLPVIIRILLPPPGRLISMTVLIRHLQT